MNVYLILPLLAFALNGLLAYPVLRASPRNPANQSFFLFLVSMSLWGLTLFAMRNSPTLSQALFWERTVLPTFIGATLFFFHFSFLYTHVRPKRWVLPAAYVAAVIIIGLIPFDLLVTAMQHKFYGYAPKVAPLFYGYVLFLYTLVAIAFLNLGQGYFNAATDEDRNRVSYIIAGLICSVLGGTTDFLPVIGLPVYPLGIVGNILFALLVTLAILRQHLFDIRLALRRGVTLTLISGAVGTLYVGLFLLINQALHMLGFTFPVWLQIVALVSAGMALQPFYGRVQQSVDRIFYQDRYDYLRALERFAQETKEINDFNLISETLVRLSTLAMSSKWACIVHPTPFDGRLVLGATHGERPALPLITVASSSPLVRWLQQREQAALAREVQVLPQWLSMPQSEMDSWHALDAKVYVPLRGKSGLTAILLLGEKSPASPYSREDLRVLQSVANHAAIAMENASLYQEISAQLERGRRRLAALQEATSRLALEEDPDRALQNLVGVARELLDTERIVLAVYSPLHQVNQIVTSGVSGDEELRLRHFLDLRLSSRIDYGSSELWAFVLGNEEFASPETLRASFVTKNRGTGVFELAGRTHGQPFLADDERLLNLFTVLAGVLLDNVDLYEDVAQERRTLAAIQESMAEGLIVLAPDRHILYCNRAAELLLNVQATRSVGRRIEETLRFKAADFETAQQLETLLASIASPPETPRTLDIGIVNPQRQDLSITFFSIPAEQDLMMTGILVRDVTQERDLSRRRDDFVSIASHELRTPMTTIMGFSELLLARDPGPEARREWLHYIHRDIQRLASIVEDLLNISRIQSGRIKVEVEPLDLADLAAGLSIVKASTSRHPVQLHIPKDLPLVIADQQKLIQILNNLVDNAIKYSPAGGIVTLRACHDAANNRAVVSVQDQGIGIAEEDRQRLFTMFHRISRPETQGIRGTGLGLYIVKEMVELMHGEIWLESQVNHGTTFFFSLPCQPAANQPEDVGSPELARHASK